LGVQVRVPRVLDELLRSRNKRLAFSTMAGLEQLEIHSKVRRIRILWRRNADRDSLTLCAG
jgi:hypothetical protein